MTKLLTIRIALPQTDIDLLKDICIEEMARLNPMNNARDSLKCIMLEKALDAIEWQFGESAKFLDEFIVQHKL